MNDFEKMIFDRYFSKAIVDYRKIQACRIPWSKGSVAIEGYKQGFEQMLEKEEFVSQCEDESNYWDNFWEDVD